MLDHSQAREAAALLFRHWEAGTRLDALPEPLRPRSRAEGYAIQSHLMAYTRKPLFGWKIAATSLAGQRHVRVDGPMAGRLLAEKVIEDGATVSLATSNMRVAEIEFAFRFGRDLPPRTKPYDVAETMAAVSTLHPAIEIPDSRFNDFCVVGAPQLIADDACANLFILGPAVGPGWRDLDLAAYPVSGVVVGKSEHEGKGANVLGDPRIALAWIVNELSSLGVALHAGEVVTTGTCVTPIAVVACDEVRAGFGRLGALSVRFS
ncbi:MAG TPA: fumarylacetoacetate hydrolase family protein [Stellaceae bacterium]|nr:fumarylacetoacetate hydrolase family protein [Stellaceae bacterium]